MIIKYKREKLTILKYAKTKPTNKIYLYYCELQEGVDLILIHSLTTCGTDVCHGHFRDNNDLVKDKGHVSRPDLRENDEKDSV